MKIAIGSDHTGYPLKSKLIHLLRERGCEVEDVGCDSPERCDYTEYGAKVGRMVAAHEADRGVCVCGTGTGISIAANKIHGIRAAVCNDIYSSEMSRRHNDANVLCMGARVVGEDLALAILDKWFSTEFDGDRHTARVKALMDLEETQ